VSTEPAAGQAHLIDVASPLYRLALTAVLDLRFTETPPPTSNLQAYLAFHRRASEFHDGQHMHERALLKARKARTAKQANVLSD
jgi:hypothetical protein